MSDQMLDAADRYFDEMEQAEIERSLGELREDISRFVVAAAGTEVSPTETVDWAIVAALHLRARMSDIVTYLNVRGDEKVDQNFLYLIRGYEDFLP
jgi:hypothetical protein